MPRIQWRDDTNYETVWQAMRDFTRQRTDTTPDEIWLLQHPPVYTLGQAGRAEHVLNPAGIPIIHSDRGGQVTYHGPGQLVAYCLVDLRRRGLFVKPYVTLLEDAVLALLAELDVSASRIAGAPGVYVPVSAPAPGASPTHGGAPSFSGWAKVAALGIKVSNGCAYHGLALNVDMDLTPFTAIDPCGYQGMVTTDLQSCGVSLSLNQAGTLLAEKLQQALHRHPHQSGAPA